MECETARVLLPIPPILFPSSHPCPFFFHTPPNTATRANLDCNLLASWLILPGSAHCLRHDPLWYAGYDVGPGQVDFAINVSASGGGRAGGGSSSPTTTTTLALSPAVPAANSPAAGIAARLLGDLAAYRAMPDFGGHVLMVPFPPGKQSREKRAWGKKKPVPSFSFSIHPRPQNFIHKKKVPPPPPP